MADSDVSDASDASDADQRQGVAQLWNDIRDIVSTRCDAHAHEAIDDALRAWLALASTCRSELCLSEDDVASCAQRLLDGHLFCANPDYVRIQIIHSLLQDDEPAHLYPIAIFLLLDGRADEACFRKMVDEGCFQRLVFLINGRDDADPALHHVLLELVYDMSRIEQLRPDDLVHVDDGFVSYLFNMIETIADDVNDSWHYPVIRVLLVLNEQYMVASATAVADPSSPSSSLTNRVVKCLSLHGETYRTFGEYIILMLNRETETSMQLLILKLFYLLFTTRATYEYFYTNDLRVLVDVIIRNLLDLPNELTSLRHTYLRVLYPLLAHTQLSQAPHYKKHELQKMIALLSRNDNAHFEAADETTLRLVDRVSKVQWLLEDGAGNGEIARRSLGISLSPTAAASSVSVVDVAAVTEKPGVQTPSRRADGDEEKKHVSHEAKIATQKPKGAKPPPPVVPRHKYGIPFAKTPPVMETVPRRKKPPTPPPARRRGRLHLTSSVSDPS
ncbi:hypothetical protein GGR57DRAFT_504266 [Xylariaceae sp. FL1272]|nr:hypothetical protein GGR57DRAFT_504266 [Xylariaceae sp. FL1272]